MKTLMHSFRLFSRVLLPAAALWVGATAPGWACSGRIAASPNPVADYNPFDAVDNVKDYRVTVENSGAEACVFALGFTRIDAGAGAAFAFAIKGVDGAALTASAPSPPSSGRLVSRALAPNETFDFTYAVAIPAGQMLAPGHYDQPFELSLTGSAGSAPPDGAPPLQTASLTLSCQVQDFLGINIAGGGTTTTIDFGVLSTGASRRVILEARSNRKFSLAVSSMKGGALAMEAPYDRWRIPYATSLNGAAVAMPASLGPFQTTSIAGQSLEAVFTIGDVSNKRAGLYSDEISIEIKPAL
ncbi:MAG: hypothetical protein WBP94_17840 [Rhodomicrobiaceae bacterium]